MKGSEDVDTSTYSKSVSVLELVAPTVHVLSRIEFHTDVMAESASSWPPKRIRDAFS